MAADSFAVSSSAQARAGFCSGRINTAYSRCGWLRIGPKGLGRAEDRSGSDTASQAQTGSGHRAGSAQAQDRLLNRRRCGYWQIDADTSQT